MANLTRFSFVILVVVGTLISADHRVVAECGGNIGDIIAQCSQFVRIPGPKIPPSQECCDALKPIDIQCACNSLTPGMLKFVSPEKAIYVGRTCGLSIPAGLKCAGYTAPPSGIHPNHI